VSSVFCLAVIRLLLVCVGGGELIVVCIGHDLGNPIDALLP